MNEMKVLSESEEMQVNGGWWWVVPIVVRVAVRSPRVQRIASDIVASAVAGYEAGKFTSKVLGQDR